MHMNSTVIWFATLFSSDDVWSSNMCFLANVGPTGKSRSHGLSKLRAGMRPPVHPILFSQPFRTVEPVLFHFLESATVNGTLNGCDCLPHRLGLFLRIH